MKTVQIRQAKAALSAVIAAAERGQPTLITPSLADYLLAMPRGSRIAFARDTKPLRDVRL